MASRAQAIEKFNAGKIQTALNIAKGFKINVTAEERDIMARGYECFAHPTTYEQMGYDLEAEKAKAIIVLKKVLGIDVTEEKEEEEVMAETTAKVEEKKTKEPQVLGWTLVMTNKKTDEVWAQRFEDVPANITERVRIARRLGYTFVCVVRDTKVNEILDGETRRSKGIYDNLKKIGYEDYQVQAFFQKVQEQLYNSNETWILIDEGRAE